MYICIDDLYENDSNLIDKKLPLYFLVAGLAGKQDLDTEIVSQQPRPEEFDTVAYPAFAAPRYK